MKYTYMLKEKELKQDWLIIDAGDKVLGRLASNIAILLKGKHKPSYVPHLDNGDNVIVINAEKVKLTGNKLKNKKYYYHTGYPGGIKERGYDKLMETKPEFVVRKAVKGMLSSGPLGRAQLRKLKIYRGSEHPHASNSPKPYTI